MDLLNGLKAMADETRLKILTMVAEKELCVEALARRLESSEASISQHLKKLREADLVAGEKRGYYVHYGVKDQAVVEFSEALKELPAHVETPEPCHGETGEHHGDCCQEEADNKC